MKKIVAKKTIAPAVAPVKAAQVPVKAPVAPVETPKALPAKKVLAQKKTEPVVAPVVEKEVPKKAPEKKTIASKKTAPAPVAEQPEESPFEDLVETEQAIYHRVHDLKDFNKVFAKEDLRGYPFRLMAIETEEVTTEFVIMFASKEFLHGVDITSTGDNRESLASFPIAEVVKGMLSKTGTPVCLYKRLPNK